MVHTPPVTAAAHGSIELRTLNDGGQSAADVAAAVAAFVGAARESVDLAQYDFNLGPETAQVVGGAIQDAAQRGVTVRFLWNADVRLPAPVPPPPEPDGTLIA